MSWEYSALLYIPLILIREGVGWGGMRGRPEMGWGAGLASGRLTFSPGADTLIDRLSWQGDPVKPVIHTNTHTHTHTHAHTYSAWANRNYSIVLSNALICVSPASMRVLLYLRWFFYKWIVTVTPSVTAPDWSRWSRWSRPQGFMWGIRFCSTKWCRFFRRFSIFS